MAERRSSTVTISGSNRTVVPAGEFPAACPNCEQPWQVSEAWIDRADYRTGGKQAICAACGCQTFEVIDIDRSPPPVPGWPRSGSQS